MDLQEIRELIKILNETDIEEFNLEGDGVKLNIRKKSGANQENPVAEANNKQQAERMQPNEEIKLPGALDETKQDDDLVPILAPMVGTFYESPAPDAASFVKLGDAVEEGKTVCIIEAMKLMNEIESEVSGEIVDVLVKNGEAVEYGQTLYLVRPNK